MSRPSPATLRLLGGLVLVGLLGSLSLASAERSHVVREGETLSAIARRYRTNVTELRQANRLRSDQLRLGQRLIIPGGATEAEARRAGFHVVRRGETLSEIAARHRVPLADLRRLNRLRGDRIQQGQRLRVPGRRAENPLPRVVARPLRPDQERAASRARTLDLGTDRAAQLLLRDPVEERWRRVAAEAPLTIPPYAYGVGTPIERDPATEAVLDEEAALGIVSEERDAPGPDAAEVEDVAYDEPDAPEEPEPSAPERDEPPEPADGEGTLLHPLEGGHFLRGWGSGAGGYHLAVDLYAPPGAPIRAVERGVVAYAGTGIRGYGRFVLIVHPSGLVSAYAHNRENLVVPGELVARGQVIARLGNTGLSRGPHLHLMLIDGGQHCDALPLLRPLARFRNGARVPTEPSAWTTSRPENVRCLARDSRPHPGAMRRSPPRRPPRR
ncbi:MAG: LysM peptidoglycan-binding domain-containing protein [Myxococcales bacterium]|nr:LysM peptidoglycan-binding domain-containing protein [Myxococcales bacterium]